MGREPSGARSVENSRGEGHGLLRVAGRGVDPMPTIPMPLMVLSLRGAINNFESMVQRGSVALALDGRVDAFEETGEEATRAGRGLGPGLRG